MFNLPTLVTLTAPSCAGKSYLLEAMVLNGFNRIVSTTDRAQRDGEIEGLHYFFLDTETSKRYEAEGLFAELVTYNGTRYGVTHAEMEKKLAGDGSPPIVILEPNGVDIYRRYCASKGWAIFSIFVSTKESIRLERLAERTTNDIMKITDHADVLKLVRTNNNRLKAVLEEERHWSASNRWDAVVDGTNVEKAIDQILLGVKNRNARKDIYK